MSYDIPTFFERKKVEEEMQIARLKAEESDKSKSEFLANMSHEIRTPMNAIMGYVDLVLKDNLDTEHREYLETVRESGQMLLALINDVLDLSKIEAGQLVVENSTCSLKELFRQVEHLANGLIKSSSSSVDLSIVIDPAISDVVLLDSMRLQQVLNNLVSNAIKFTPKGGVEFGVKVVDKELLFYVKDSGIGIAAKDFDKIFKMFGQADASTTRKFGGSGLGLTISKKIIDLLGGKMWVESELGRGSNFQFTIPYNPIIKVKTLVAETDSISQEKELLLLVEDNLINQRLTKLILEKSGYAVLTANNGQVAVDLFKSNPKIKLIIMDIQMPVLDGLSATKEIRTLEFENKLSKIPIIALTAHAMKGDKEKCLEAGCDNYLSKPILIELLVNTIKKYI
jgi:CheY-like chemotaxis protein/nitrogen-specific signal transduction histidine kinase